MFRALRYPNFRLFFLGQSLSLCGSWMQGTAMSWLVYRLTKDPLMLGLVNFVSQFPVFLLGFYTGHLVDRLNHRRIVIVMQIVAMLQAAALAWLTLTGQVALWHIFALSFVLGAVYSLEIPARQVMIGELVEASDRSNALALNSMIVNGSRMLAPAAAGFLIAAAGEGWCFALNAVSYLSVIAGLLLMRGVRQAPSLSQGGAWEEIGNGVAYALSHDGLRVSLGMLVAFSLAALPLYVLLPLFADGILAAGAQGLGLLSSFSGLGSTLGALFLARRRVAADLADWIGKAFCAFGLALMAMALSASLWLSCLLMLLLGLSALVVLAGTNALLQDLSSDRFRGRIMSFYSMIFIGLVPIAGFVVAAVAARTGVRGTAALMAVVCVVAGLAYRHKLRLYRLDYPPAPDMGPKAQFVVGP